MGSFTVFPSKITSSTISLQFDFLSQLASGETISGATVTAVVWSGTDANPSAIISGAASVSGSIVSQTVTAGTAGVIYLLTCSVTTSLSVTKIIQAYLAVIDSNPYEA